jgi:mono/diheme cytochrome c family protein
MAKNSARSLLALILLVPLAIVVKAQRPIDDGRPAKAAAPPAQVPAPAPPSAEDFEEIVKPFLAENCIRCHGNKKHEKDLNFQKFTSPESLIEHYERWEEVARKLKAEEMPPLEEDQPDDNERQAVAKWVQRELDRIDRETPPDPGRVTARRLNRTEYNNSVRDLLGVDSRPADDFPQDDSGYGFDNIADVLSLSPVLMEKYVTAADRVARLALFGPSRMSPTLTRLRSDGRKAGDAKVAPQAYDLTGLSMPNAFHANYRVPIAGEYAVRVVLGGARPAGSAPIAVTLWVDDRQLQSRDFDLEGSARFDLDRQDFGGQALEFRLELAEGDHHIAVAIPRIFEGLPPSLNGPNPSTRPEPSKVFVAPPNTPPERIESLKQRFDAAQVELAKIPLNGVRVNTVDVGGPYTQVTGPSRVSRQKIYLCGHQPGKHLPTCPTVIMTSLAKRAFRRPVAPGEVQKYVDLVKLAERQEGSLDEGLAVGIQALLVSPDFLFRIERDRSVKPGPTAMTAKAASLVQPISDHELAARLSYFLWASMPDAALRRAADAGTLRKPAVLEAQVHRMLRDPKADALAEHFGGQWLQFRALESITRDRDRFPDFDDYLRYSMKRETMLFVENVVKEDRSILDFIDGQYSFVNERLARHYGINGVSGPEFRRVDLSGTPRGGVLTQGSVLTVSSYATRTSPVMRGKWILENLLDAPPPPPPADVPNLDESAIGTAASMRAQLESHRKDPICASCHRRMDPLGFGLENFDAVGAWRTMDGKFPIDASGALPDGREFTGPVELRTILEGNRDAFVKCLTTKLLTYALGRGVERYDVKTVKEIAARLPSQNYRFSALVLDIVTSMPFQSRRPSSLDVPRPVKGTDQP